MTDFKFGPAARDEQIVSGARRPGYNSTCVEKEVVDEWIAFMQQRKIRRVVCLLEEEQLKFYSSLPSGLLARYNQDFGQGKVLPAPIPDFKLSSRQNLKCILDFLTKARDAREKVVVHCSGGSGRTGHVLACWLVRARGFEVEKALEAVEEMGRCPREAVSRNATEEDLMELLASCRP